MVLDIDRDDTIVAPATPPGVGALAVVRLSGRATLDVLSRVFRRDRGRRSMPAFRPVLGTVLDSTGEPIDRGLATWFPGPRSYTGEDLAELSVHGSPAVVRALLEACRAAGARPAEPGEFTFRALRAGKLDLAQAEAVADLAAAATLPQARIAARQLAGEVGRALAPLAEESLALLADVEAGLDFSEDEDLGPGADEIARRARVLADRLDELLARGEMAARVREGVRVVLLGPPNAGKSTLFNALVGRNRAIVTPEPGTTRDLVEEAVVLDGMPVILVDTAGVREAHGLAEREGVRRALRVAEGAALVLEVYSLAGAWRPAGEPGPGRLRVATHADVRWKGEPAPGSLLVSPLTGEGMDDLRRRIGEAVGAPGADPLPSVALASARHRAAASRAAGHLREAASLAAKVPGEVVALPLREAVRALREILGDVDAERVLGSIFSRFCIGK